MALTIRQISKSKADRKAFVDIQFRLNEGDPHWVPPLKDEVHGLITPGKNPWFGHGEAAFFLAERDGTVVGRVSAQDDRLLADIPEELAGGKHVGHWGMLEADDEPTAAALIATAEDWLRKRGKTKSIGPISISIWDEPGLLVKGHDHPPTVMMGHHRPEYEGWVERAGYVGVKDLNTYDLQIVPEFPPLVQRIVASGERNARIRVRRVDKSRFAEEATLLLNILNDAWSDNWGFVPLTDEEIAYAGKKLKPIVFEDLIMVAEVDGEPVAFMVTLPDLNEKLRLFGGSLLPFNWAKLLWWLRKPQVKTMRVPLMGVVKRLQATRLASQLAFMMIEYIRREAITTYGATRGEIGWVLEDNQGMVSIAEMLRGKINRIYRLYEKTLA